MDEKVGISVDSRKSGVGTMRGETKGVDVSIDIHTEVLEESDGRHTVSFTPTDIGYYETNIFWNEKLVKGSPFKVKIIAIFWSAVK